MLLEYFPPIAPALQNEIRNHPVLSNALARLPEEVTMEERFGVVLAYCGMAVDGYYDNKQMEILFGHALAKLKSMSTLRAQ